MTMVAIFTRTTSVLSTQFVCKFSTDNLVKTLSKVQKETGVEFYRQSESFSISGHWNDIVKAHQSLEQLESVSETVKNKVVETESANTQNILQPSVLQPSAEKEKRGRKPGSTVCRKSQNSTIPEPLVVNSQTDKNWIIADDTPGSVSLNYSSKNNMVDENMINLKTNEVKVSSDTANKSFPEHANHNNINAHMVKRNEANLANELDTTCSQSEMKIKVETETLETSTSVKESSLKEEKKRVNAETPEKVEKKSKNNNNGSKRFACVHCDYVTGNKESLKSHRKRKHRLTKFACDVCGRQFGVNRDMQRHKKQVHSDPAYSCDTCKKSYKCKKSYTCHIKTHIKVEKDTTKVDEKDTSDYEHVHDDSLEEDNEDGFRCDICSYVGAKRYLLKEHQKRMHRNKFKCEECDKTFGFNKDLNRHKKFVHSEPAFLCEICRKFYRSKRAFDEHVQTHKDNYVKENFSCEQCPKKFSTKYVLAAHVKSEHFGMKNSFVCPICSKSFTQRGSYLIHANVHAGIKPHVCDICGVSFSYENSYKRHKMIHDGTQTFPCTVCSKVFSHPSNLKTHMKVHKDKRDYLCEVCGKGFTQRQALLRHERVHTGDKPYMCELCNRSFTDYSIIRRHLMLMHKKDKKNWKNFIISRVKNSEYFIQQVPPRETKVTAETTGAASDKQVYIDNDIIMNKQADQKFSAQDPLVATRCLTGDTSHDIAGIPPFNVPTTQTYHLSHAQVNKPLPLVGTSYPSDSFNNNPDNWSHLSGNLTLPAESVLQLSDTQIHY